MREKMQKCPSSDCHLPDNATDKNRAGWLAGGERDIVE